MKYEKVVKKNHVLIKILERRIDSTLTPEFKKNLLAHIVQDSPNIIIDLSDIDYMDSSGLGALLFGKRQAERFLGNLVIINPGPKVQKLIEIARLSQTLLVFETERKAINSFNKEKK